MMFVVARHSTGHKNVMYEKYQTGEERYTMICTLYCDITRHDHAFLSDTIKNKEAVGQIIMPR